MTDSSGIVITITGSTNDTNLVLNSTSGAITDGDAASATLVAEVSSNAAAAATAQTQADLGVTNAATAQTQADLGVTNAAANAASIVALEAAMVDPHQVDITSTLGYWEVLPGEVIYHIHEDSSGDLFYTLMAKSTNMGGTTDSMWVNMFKVPLMADYSRVNTLRVTIPLLMRAPGMPLAPVGPKIRGYDNGTMSFSNDYNTLYLDGGLRLLLDENATSAEKQALAERWYGTDSSDIDIPLGQWVRDFGGRNLDGTRVTAPTSIVNLSDYDDGAEYAAYYSSIPDAVMPTKYKCVD
jgi:hypothetical protein